MTREDEAGDEVFVPKSMSEQDARITLVNGFFSACLPRINRVLDVPVPHLSDDGKLVYPTPGYDPRFGTWLNPHAPQLKTMGLERGAALAAPGFVRPARARRVLVA